MGDFDSSEYYDAYKRYSEALEKPDFVQAAWFLRRGLELAPVVVARWDEQGAPRAFIPFVGQRAAIVAAIVQEPDLIELMESVAPLSRQNPGVDETALVGLYGHYFDFVLHIRREIQKPGTKLSQIELRRLVPEPLQHEISILLRYMEQAGELSRLKEGGRVFITKRSDPVEQSILGGGFREGAHPIKPLSMALPTPKPIPWDVVSEANEVIQIQPEALQLVPQSQRLSRASVTHALKSGQWLIGAFPNSLDSPITNVVVKNWSGTTLKTLEIPGRYASVHTSPSRDTAVFISKDKDVAVYDFEGELRGMFSLNSTPEIIEFQQQFEPQPKIRQFVRAVDVSPLNGDRVFTAVNTLWWFSKDGAAKTAVTFNNGRTEDPGSFVFEFDILTEVELDGPESESNLAAIGLKEPGEVGLVRHRKGPLVGYVDDWIYFVRLSENLDELFVGFYSGLFLKLDSEGGVRDAWQFGDSAVTDVLETDEQLIAFSAQGFARLFPEGRGEGFNVTQAFRGRVLSASSMMTRHESDFQIVDIITNSAQLLEVNRPVKAVYSVGSDICFDFGTKTYLLS